MATTNSSKATTANRATRRAAPKKAAAPAEAHLSISALEREAVGDTFKVELRDGTIVEVGDPQDLDYRVLTSSDPFQAFEETMSEEDYAALLDDGLKAWQFKIIFESWRAHYGIGTPGE